VKLAKTKYNTILTGVKACFEPGPSLIKVFSKFLPKAAEALFVHKILPSQGLIYQKTTYRNA